MAVTTTTTTNNTTLLFGFFALCFLCGSHLGLAATPLCEAVEWLQKNDTTLLPMLPRQSSPISTSSPPTFIPGKKLSVNELFCKTPNQVTADDFLFKGLNVAGNTTNKLGSSMIVVVPPVLPGLNTLGISLARLDFAPYGLVAPHFHPRATEVLTLLEGTLYVGFVASNQPDNAPNKLFTKVLYPGDVFVFPHALIHFHFNVGKTNAVAISGFSSQNPGITTIANVMFGSEPPIFVDALSKAFQLDPKTIKELQSMF